MFPGIIISFSCLADKEKLKTSKRVISTIREGTVCRLCTLSSIFALSWSPLVIAKWETISMGLASKRPIGQAFICWSKTRPHGSQQMCYCYVCHKTWPSCREKNALCRQLYGTMKDQVTFLSIIITMPKRFIKTKMPLK